MMILFSACGEMFFLELINLELIKCLKSSPETTVPSLKGLDMAHLIIYFLVIYFYV